MSKHWDDVEAQIVDGKVSAEEWDRTEERITDGEISVEERVQFTPGPWHIERALDRFEVWSYSAGPKGDAAERIANVLATGADPTASVDARLIAAAPAMHDDHRANAADAASLAEAIRDERWDDARMLAGVIARRSEGAVHAGEGKETP